MSPRLFTINDSFCHIFVMYVYIFYTLNLIAIMGQKKYNIISIKYNSTLNLMTAKCDL